MSEQGIIPPGQNDQKPCSSNASDSRTVESDSDTEIDSATYERKREECMRKIILLEKVFNTTKKRLYDERMKQLEARQTELLNQTAPDFLAKKAILSEERRARIEYNKAVRDLRMGSLKRKSLGNFHNMEADTMRTHDLVREKLEDEIYGEISRLRSEIAKAEEELRNFSDKCIRQSRIEEEEAIKSLKNLTGAPVVIYMARKEEITSDLNLAEEAIFLAESENFRQSHSDNVRLMEKKPVRLVMSEL